MLPRAAVVPILGIVAALLLPAAAQAHDGFYLRGGAGLGYYSTSAEFAGRDESLSGLSIPMELLVGGSIFSGFVVGGGLSVDYAPSPSYTQNGMDVSIADVSQFLIAIGPFVDFYPDPDAGYHGQFRIGWGGLETSVDGGVGGSDPTGLVMSLGGGYDYWLTDVLGVGGLARFTYAPLSQNDVTFHTLAFNLLASVTYY